MDGPHRAGQSSGMQKLALAVIAFSTFSLYTLLVMVEHGPLGFLPLITAGGWSTQVFLDLVTGLLGFLVLATPDARRRGISISPFVLATLVCGSVGMLAYFVRRQWTDAHSPG